MLFKVLVSHFDVILRHCYKFQPMYRYIDGVNLKILLFTILRSLKKTTT